MNLPISWLKEYTDPNCSVKEYCDAMTLSGSKVECVTSPGAEISGVVVGKVISIDKHENAEKLFITKIDIGSGAPLQIVTGATNLKTGVCVPVATDGATLANGVTIKKGQLRGADSEGMLCSISELGYTVHDYPEACEDGIYIFTDEQKPGADVREILQLCDDVVEFEITSNRPDCFSIIGLARESAATFGTELKLPECAPKENAGGSASDFIEVEIRNTELCPRYVARIVKNVKIEPSPLWMRHRLTAAGIRPINNIVDITNYVMLEYGQPMHSFDIDCINGGKIIVRNAEKGEKFTTLDKEERILDETMLVIADFEKAVAVAGVMGGENSKISEGAAAVLFESANFNGTSVRLTSKKLGLRTDSSSKFEKGLDPELALTAADRAAELVELLGCGEVVCGRVDCYPQKRIKRSVKYSADSVNRLIGLKLSEKEMTEYLKRLEIVAENGTAVVPTFRPDIEHETDIAEEVARLYGYNRIPSTLPFSRPTIGKKTETQLFEDAVKRTLTANGLCEALSYAFESPKVFDKLRLPETSPLRNAVRINNPLGEDFGIMRTTTLNSMLTSLSANYNRRNEQAWLFELAKSYEPKKNELPHEQPLITVGMYGSCDFYDAKGIVNALESTFGFKAEYLPETALPFMHPGRTAKIFVKGEQAGFVGEIHPEVALSYEIGAKAYVAVLKTDILFKNAELVPTYAPLPRFPRMKRDIAMFVKDEITAGEIEGAITSAASSLLESCHCFDVYRGDLKDGLKSVAFSLTFRSPDRTLRDEEVVAEMKNVVLALESKLNAKIRDK